MGATGLGLVAGGGTHLSVDLAGSGPNTLIPTWGLLLASAGLGALACSRLTISRSKRAALLAMPLVMTLGAEHLLRAAGALSLSSEAAGAAALWALGAGAVLGLAGALATLAGPVGGRPRAGWAALLGFGAALWLPPALSMALAGAAAVAVADHPLGRRRGPGLRADLAGLAGISLGVASLAQTWMALRGGLTPDLGGTWVAVGAAVGDAVGGRHVAPGVLSTSHEQPMHSEVTR